MKKKIIILITIIVVLTIAVAGVMLCKANKTEGTLQNENAQEPEQENNEEPKEIVVEEKNDLPENQEEINSLKDNSGKTGDTELYEIQEGYNNTKIVTIKSSIKYKVAFSGMIENKKPEMNKLDNILQGKHPKYAGIWIYEKDRENILEMLKEITNSEYKIDENGYLKIVNKNNQNENDKKLEKAIKGEKLYIIRNSSICYIVDEVTGEILDYNFENMDQYQTYEYFEDGDKMIIFMNENTKKQMTSKEILESVINLF